MQKFVRTRRRAKKRGKIVDRVKAKVAGRALKTMKEMRRTAQELKNLPEQLRDDAKELRNMVKTWKPPGLRKGFFSRMKKKVIQTPVWVHIPTSIKEQSK